MNARRTFTTVQVSGVAEFLWLGVPNFLWISVQLVKCAPISGQRIWEQVGRD